MRQAVWVAAALLMAASAMSFAGAQEYAPTPLSATDVLAKSAAAGGELQPGSYLEIEQTETGGLQSLATTHFSGDDWLERDVSGPFTSASGLYQGQQWWQDENGLVALVSRFRARTDPNVLAWLHPDDPKFNVRVLGITTTAPREYVLEANPPGGSDEYRYYDAKTFLLDRVVRFDKDRHRHVTQYSDYRTVFGRTRWFKSTYSDGRPQNDETTRLLAFRSEAAPAQALSVPAARPLFEVGATPVPLPARFTRDGVVVRVTIAGRGLDFLLDSGASNILLDPGIAHELGLKGYGKTTTTIGGDFDTSLARVPQMSVGALKLNDVAVELGPIDDRLPGARVVGLLGYDFLANAMPCIDFPGKRVNLYSRTAFNARSSQFTAMPMMVDDGVPRVPAFFEKHMGWFMLDTGAFGTLLYQQYISKLPSAGAADTELNAISAVGGDVPTRWFNVYDFAFGPALFRRAVVAVPQTSTFDTPDYDGIIGRDALSKYEACLDYTNRQAFVRMPPDVH